MFFALRIEAMSFSGYIVLMPEVSRFFGVVIRMFYDDHNPPHFHCYYQNYEAVYDIGTSRSVRGLLPPKIDRVVFDWAKKYRKELLKNWNLMKEEARFEKIPGAHK